MEIPFVLALMVVAAVLFSIERVPVDVVALAVLVALLVPGILTPAEALAGFASEPVVVIGGIFVLTAGLRSSGALEVVGRWARWVGAGRPRRSLAVLLVMVAAISAFMNNTTCTAVFLPVALALARAGRMSPSEVLMPMAFASILGGSITLVGTSTNVIVSGLLPQFGQPPLGMFELLPVALPVAVVGIVYLLLFSSRLLPRRQEGGLEQDYHIRDFLTEVLVLPRSPLIGRSVAEAGFGKDHDLNLLGLIRDGRRTLAGPEDRLKAGDLLLVEGRLETLVGLQESRGLAIREGGERSTRALRGGNRKLVEAVVLPRSELVGRTLKEFRFRQRFGAGVVALNRHGEPLLDKVGRIRIRVGDVLLLLGEGRAISSVLAQTGLLVLSDRVTPERSLRTLITAPAIFVAAVLLATTGLLSLAGAILLGCLLMLASRSLTPQEAYAAVDWRLLVLIAGMMAYAAAMAKTGAAELLAAKLLAVAGGLGPLAVLAGFYLLTVLLTQPMSNQAAALVVLPVALGVALEAGIHPRAMAVTVALAASSSFLTPLEPSCLLVYGPGRYRFMDFPRLGAGLTLLALLLTLLLVPLVWPVR